jgi:5'-3' exonuclease
MTVALIDADVVAYRASAAAQEDVEWGDGLTGATINTKAAIYNAHSLVRTWSGMIRPHKIILCFSDPNGHNFRRKVGPYKQDRGEKPGAYWEVVASLSAEWEVKTIPWLEADDVMGIMGTSQKLKNPIIVSIDKDMKGIPGKLLNPLKDKRARVIKPVEADRFWMYQVLVGDKVDGYSGCPGIGPVKAERILAPCKDLAAMWAAVRDTFTDRGLTEADALQQARFARILRREDYDKTKETITLWHPTPSKRTRIDLTAQS